jgi:hypothetical protein
MRIYSGINPNGQSRIVGKDAIRVYLFSRDDKGCIFKVGGSKRVHRVMGWKENLAQRIQDWKNNLGPSCPLCKSPTVLKEPGKGKSWKPFYGCCHFPACSGIVKIECEDSPTGKHEFVKDFEYDMAHPPTVCEHCGKPKK